MSVEIPLFSCKFFLLLLAVSYLPPALPHLLWPSSAALMGADVTTMGLIGGNGCGGRRSVRCAGKYVILRLFGGDGDAKSGNVKDDEMLARCQDTLGPQSSSEGGLESEKMQDEENVVRGQDAWSWRASVAGGMDGGTDGAERTVALTDTSFAPGSIVQEWEIAQGLDDIFNTFTYFRNKKFGHIVELNHVRCGGFRFTTGGWTGPQWAFSSGNFLPVFPPTPVDPALSLHVAGQGCSENSPEETFLKRCLFSFPPLDPVLPFLCILKQNHKMGFVDL